MRELRVEAKKNLDDNAFKDFIAKIRWDTLEADWWALKKNEEKKSELKIEITKTEVSWNNQDITGLAANVKERLSEHLSKLKSELGPPPPPTVPGATQG